MTSSSLPVTGLLTVLGTIFTGLMVLTLWVWRHTTSLDGEDEDRIRELENDQESAYKAELADLYLNIERYINESSPKPEDMKRDEYVVNVIERKIEEGDMESVVQELDEIGTSEELWDVHRECYKKAYKSFGKTAVTVLGLIFILTILAYSQNDPFSTGANFVYALIVAVGLTFGWDGVKYFNRARMKKEDFEEVWRDYKRIS